MNTYQTTVQCLVCGQPLLVFEHNTLDYDAVAVAELLQPLRSAHAGYSPRCPLDARWVPPCGYFGATVVKGAGVLGPFVTVGPRKVIDPRPDAEEFKTAKQIVEEIQELAEEFARLNGWVIAVKPSAPWYNETRTRTRVFWEMAAHAYEKLTGTEVQDAVTEHEEITTRILNP